eukprot:COSAG05_NODE_18683_length_304_cov_1.717073_1_plen_33_part_01
MDLQVHNTGLPTALYYLSKMKQMRTNNMIRFLS